MAIMLIVDKNRNLELEQDELDDLKQRMRRNPVPEVTSQPRMNNVRRRRRMAQREFSSRRDSPVMVRLLQQIIDAQDD